MFITLPCSNKKKLKGIEKHSIFATQNFDLEVSIATSVYSIQERHSVNPFLVIGVIKHLRKFDVKL